MQTITNSQPGQDLNHFNEDYVLEQIMNEGNTSSFLGIHIGRIGRAKADAKIELKDRLKKKYGKHWWTPKNYLKYKHDYKLEKNNVVQDAVSKAKRERFEEKEARKETRAERKDTRKEEKESRAYETQLNRQMQISNLQMQGSQNMGTQQPVAKEEEKKSKVGLYAGIGGGLLLIIAIVLVVVYKNK